MDHLLALSADQYDGLSIAPFKFDVMASEWNVALAQWAAGHPASANRCIAPEGW